MQERPILFNSDMVRAILDGRKSQTRRMMKAQPPENCNDSLFDFSGHGFFFEDLDSAGNCLNVWPKGGSGTSCPYGVPGDRLWVREAFNYTPDKSAIYYKAGMDSPELKWKDSRLMPKWAARIWLEITNIRVESVQDITRKESMKEGVPYTELNNHRPDELHRAQFADLWDSCYGAGVWERNDWVWVIEFKLLTEGKDA